MRRIDCNLRSLRLRTVIICAVCCVIGLMVFTSSLVTLTERDYLHDVLERERVGVCRSALERSQGYLQLDFDTLLRAASQQRAANPNSLDSLVNSDQNLADKAQIYETLRVVIDEMLSIKRSFSDELVHLEAKRARVLYDLRVENDTVNNLRVERDRLRSELETLRVEVKALRSELQFAQRDYALRGSQPLMYLPLRIVPFDGECQSNNRSTSHSQAELQALTSSSSSVSTASSPYDLYKRCTVDACIDFSRCSVAHRMPVYVYQLGEILSGDEYQEQSTDEYFAVLRDAVQGTPFATRDGESACLYLVIATDSVTDVLNQLWFESDRRIDGFQRRLAARLRFFDRGNHVIHLVPRARRASDSLLDAFSHLPVIIAHSGAELRPSFDITTSSLQPVLRPPFSTSASDAVWRFLPPVLPARRRYIASFHAAPVSAESAARSQDRLIGVLTRFASQRSGAYAFEFNCGADGELGPLAEPGDWLPCFNSTYRLKMLRESTFCLVVSGVSGLVNNQREQVRSYARSSELTQLRVLECMLGGAVPLVLGSAIELPFSSLFTWQRATLRLPIARVTELHVMLSSLTDDDIVELRRAGRLFVEQRLATSSKQHETLLHALRARLVVLPHAVEDVHVQSVFEYVNETEPGWTSASRFEPTRKDLPVADDVNAEEPIGPRVEAVRNSPAFRFNYTQAVWMMGQFGGALFGTESLYPHFPFGPALPSDAKFRGSAFGFRPLNNGLGGAGAEFSLAIGGNRPFEQFTAVILSYERDVELMLALRRLKGVPYLHSVVVVWNSGSRPSSSLVWPIIGVPVHVVKPPRNSLNNRFLPFDLIQTEAVLCLDDDVTLRHDEVVFAFRAWRETPERIVGFPARYHAWHADTDTFTYDSNYTCEYSMILTGAAFVHKYYFYLYSYSQPSAVRALVDSYMNCEDIAMNFLVSHVTRKPPVKVTSRWTFHCANCPVVLSLDETHFSERHACINRLSEIYGYNPLLMSQYRADSVLFKTRIPSSKQKCYKYV